MPIKESIKKDLIILFFRCLLNDIQTLFLGLCETLVVNAMVLRAKPVIRETS